MPFFPQTEYQCGPAALATVLADSGVAVTPQDITDAVYIPGLKGSLQIELIAAARRFGRIPFVIPAAGGALLAELNAGNPVLVLQNLAFEKFPRWHYAVVFGYEPGSDRFLLRSGRKARKFERSSLFLRSWELADNWAVVTVSPGRIPASATADSWARAIAASEGFVGAETAAAAYREALERWPDDTLLLFAGANFFYGGGQLREARALYRRLLRLEPGHVAGRNNLGNLLLDSGCPEAALEEIRVAVLNLDEDDLLAPAVTDSLLDAQAALRSRAETAETCTLR